jgi:hypothetical protein
LAGEWAEKTPLPSAHSPEPSHRPTARWSSTRLVWPPPDDQQPTVLPSWRAALVRAGSARHRNRRSSPVLAGTSGQGRYTRSPGHKAFEPRTSAAEAARKRLRIPGDGCRGPAALANEADVTKDGPHLPAELVPSLPGPSHVHPHRPCPERALSIGRQRSFTNKRVGACSLRAVGSLHLERSEGASQARGARVNDSLARHQAV